KDDRVTRVEVLVHPPHRDVAFGHEERPASFAPLGEQHLQRGPGRRRNPLVVPRFRLQLVEEPLQFRSGAQGFLGKPLIFSHLISSAPLPGHTNTLGPRTIVMSIPLQTYLHVVGLRSVPPPPEPANLQFVSSGQAMPRDGAAFWSASTCCAAL